MLRRRADGDCCAAGSFYALQQDACLSFGPVSCAATVGEAPADCVPDWCVERQDKAGDACAGDAAVGCHLWGHPCTPDELAAGLGCPAGWFPDADGCHRAGGALVPPAGMAALDLMPPAALPPASPPQWCAGADGKPGHCLPGQAGCPPGFEPGADQSCQPLRGVAWLCPTGFLVDAAAVGVDDLPACLPDPASCSDAPFGGIQSAPGRYFVDAQNAMLGVGSRTNPWKFLTSAIAKAPAGATLILAGGTHAAGVTINKALHLRGACAKAARIYGPGGQSTLTFEGQAAGPSSVRDLTILGPNKAVAVEAGAEVLLERVYVQGARSVGLRSRGGATMTIRDSVVTGTAELINPQSPANMNKFGRGIAAEQASQLVVERVRVSKNRDIGFAVVGGSKATIDGLLVDGTRIEKATGLMGWGLAVLDGSEVVLRGGRLHGNRGRGILVMGEGSSLQSERLVVESTLPTGVPFQGSLVGRGIDVEGGASLDLRLARISDNHEVGLVVFGAATSLYAADVMIENTKAEVAAGLNGRGLDIYAASQVTVRRVWIRANRDIGLFASGATAVVNAADLLVEGTLPRAADKAYGRGINLQDGASGQLSRVRVSGNRTTGIIVAGKGSRLDAADLVVDGTLPEAATGQGGRGLDCTACDSVRLRRAWLRGNHAVGLHVNGANARLQASDLLVADTRPASGLGHGGRGMVLAAGAAAVIEGGRIAGNEDIAVLVYNEATLHGGDVWIERTAATADGTHGRGLDVEQLSECRLAGLRVEHAKEIGVGSKESSVALVGALIEDIEPHMEGAKAQLGVGVLSEQIMNVVGHLDLHASRIRRSTTAGALLNAGSALLDHVVITQTRVAGLSDIDQNNMANILADGIIIELADVVARRCVIAGHPRSGALVSKEGSLLLQRSALSDSNWGVVTQHGGTATTFGSAMWGHGQANMASDAGLLLPTPPRAVAP